MIAVRPKPWTRHHTHRLFHISLGLVFAYIIGMLSAGLVVAWWQVSASDEVTISARIGDVEPGPTVIGGGGSGGGPVPIANPPVTEPTQPIEEPKVDLESLMPDAQQQVIDSPAGPIKVYIFNTRRPPFKGVTSMPFALIFLEVHSDFVLHGTAQADEKGRWQWYPPEDIAPGPHKLLVTTVDPNNPARVARASLDFYIETNAPSKTPKPIVPVSNAFFKELFGIFLTIPSQYKAVAAGDNVVADLRLYSQGDTVTKDIKYSVVGPDNDVVLEVSETLPLGEEIAFKKTFITHPGARAGTYTIHVKVPNLINTAVASDKFLILSPPTGLAGTSVPTTPLMIEMLLALLLLFIVLTIFAYRRVLVLTRRIREQNLVHSH